ncbi:MAG: hypothetical protein Q8K60_09100 [Parachlamydiaceae bacterium]|nr:hypothetical protein [Parachlamydiaceae bacterium]
MQEQADSEAVSIHYQEEKKHHFFGKPIIRRSEQEHIQNLLKKYRHEKVTEELKQKIWDELQMEKYKGNVTIPFKVVMRRDETRKFPDYIEIILDSKV